MQSPFPDWLWPKQKARIKTLRTSSKWIKTGVSFNSQKKKHPLGRLANCIGFMLPHPPPGPKETERSLKERGRTHVEVSGFEIPNSMTFRSHLATNSHFAHKLGKANRGTKLLSLSYFHKQKFQGMALVHIVNQHTKSCLMPPCQKRENLVPAQNSQGTMFFCCPYLAWTTAITIITTTSATTTTPRLMTFKQANLGDLPQLWMPCELPSLKLPLAKSIMCACRVYINSLYSPTWKKIDVSVHPHLANCWRQRKNPGDVDACQAAPGGREVSLGPSMKKSKSKDLKKKNTNEPSLKCLRQIAHCLQSYWSAIQRKTHKKNIQKESNRKPIVATIFPYNSAEVHWILKVWHHKKLTQKIKVALAPAHQANSLAFALAILALHLGRQQSVHSGVENVDKLISTSLPWKPGRNPELL